MAAQSPAVAPSLAVAQTMAPAPSSALSSLADTLVCAPQYPTALAADEEQERRSACLRGNGLKDGYGYWFNTGRGTPGAACEGSCWCCRRNITRIPETRGWALAGAGTSCRNWRHIQMFRTTTVDSPSVCGQLCQANKGCVSFAHVSADSCLEVGVRAKGSCMLFFGACDRQPSSCWDLYAMRASDGTEADSPPMTVAPPVAATTTAAPTTTTTTAETQATAEALVRMLPDASPGGGATGSGPDRMLLPDTATDEGLCSLAGPLSCTQWPTPPEGGDLRSACLHGNLLKDGHHYVHNAARGTEMSCGDCDCCRRDTSAVPETKSYMLKASGASCRNWRMIQMFRTVTVNSSSTCGRLCAANRGCVQFAYLGADGCTEGGVSARGSCMLFSGECERQASSCWALHAMQTTEPPEPPLLASMDSSIGAVDLLGAQHQKALRTVEGLVHGWWPGFVAVLLATLLASAVGMAVRHARVRRKTRGDETVMPDFLGRLGWRSPHSSMALLPTSSPGRPARGAQELADA